jgi:predicted permease
VTALRVLLSRLLDLLLGRRREERLTDEIQTHLDLLTDELIAQGMLPDDARRAARRAFGGVDRAKAAYRDQRGLPVLDALAQDVRFALRLLRRERAFSATAVLVLTLGIGVNNMLFTILNAHTLRGLPLLHADRVLAISTIDDRGQSRGVSFADFTDLRDNARAFSALAAFTNMPAIVAGDGHVPDRLDGAFISGDAVAITGRQPVAGRWFSTAENRGGAERVAILGYGVWQARYGGDRAILGRSILVNASPATVIGIMPDRSGFPSSAQIWLPLAQLPGLDALKRRDRNLAVVGRVRDDLATDEAAVEIRTLADRLAADHPDTNRAVRALVVGIDERYIGTWKHPAWFAFITAGFLIVLISSANVANLMLARAVVRAREIAIRTSLGASRARIVRQLLIEGTVLAGCGGVLGLGLAIALVRLFRSAIPADALPYWVHYSMDGRVVAALVGVSIGTVFVFALLPAIHASKTDVQGVLKDEGVTTPARRSARRWTTAFLTAELALAVVLMAQVTLTLRLARPSLPSDRVIDTGQVLTAAITLPAERYRTPAQRADFYRRVGERLSGQPGVASVSIVSAPPLVGAPERRLTIAGRAQTVDRPDTVMTVAIGQGYFETLSLSLVRGRGLIDEDATPPHVLVNERFVREFFPDADPVGQRVAISAVDAAPAALDWATIVGVAPDIRQRPSPDPDPIVYLAYASAPAATATLLVRGRTDAAPLGPMLREEVAALDANLPLYRMRTLAQSIRDAGWNSRLSSTLILFLTFVAVGLSTVGLYAVTTHTVNQQTREIGVRMALGARPAQVARLILRRTFFQLVLGFLAGVALTRLWAAAFASESARADASITDPGTLLTAAGMLTVVALIATLIPIRTAIRLDPVRAIRHQ